MSIVGVFTKANPSIGGLFFDAVLEEQTELLSEVSEFPLETGALGNDHVVVKPLTIMMTIGISDNPFRALSASSNIPIAGSLAGTGVGVAIGQLSGTGAALVGVAGSVANAAYSAGQASTRSQAVLDQFRALQKAGQFVDVVGAKDKTYANCLIKSTRQQTTTENENGLELVIELVQPVIIETVRINRSIDKDRLPANDSASTQAQPVTDFGEVSAIA